MGDELSRGIGKYWVLFLQPLPEAGERVAIALVYCDKTDRPVVEYDPGFSKALKLYSDLDADGLRYCLDTLQTDLRSSDQIEATLNSYGPQISASNARKIASPVSEHVIDMLLARYVYPPKGKRARKERKDTVGEEIAVFVRNNAGPDIQFKTGVSAREIVGHRVPGTKPIAVAIPSRQGWTLIDGVDLNQLTAPAAINRADDVARTYWSYSRMAAEAGVQIRRVGVVLNGHSHLSLSTHEAHDYALHRFQDDSDLALDNVSTEAGARLRELLARTEE
jgi:hypothetical protein